MRKIVLTVVAIVSLLLLSTASAPQVARAAAVQAFTLTPNVTTTGTTVTATASWVATDDSAPAILFQLPAALIGVATWSIPVAAPAESACLAGASSGEAACLWLEPHIAGDVITLTSTLTLPAGAPPGLHTITASTDPSFPTGTMTADLEILSSATPTVAVTPASVNPGQSATPTATFTATSTGTIRVSVALLGTAGAATLAAPAATTGLSNCVLDASLLSYSCDWLTAVIGDTRVLQPPVAIAASTAPGSSVQVQACTNPTTSASQCAQTSLAVVAAADAPAPAPDPNAPILQQERLAETGADQARLASAVLGALLLTAGLTLIIVQRRAQKGPIIRS